MGILELSVIILYSISLSRHVKIIKSYFVRYNPIAIIITSFNCFFIRLIIRYFTSFAFELHDYIVYNNLFLLLVILLSLSLGGPILLLL